MFRLLIKVVRYVIWKIIGSDPRLEHYVDLIQPRKEMIGYAVSFVEHNTRFEKKDSPGQKDSLTGDYLEFGCYKGNSFIHAYKCAYRIMPDMRFFAFDSFEGLPELSDIDKNGPFKKGQFACSRDEFTGNLKKAKVDIDRINCVPGWFKDTLNDGLKKDLKLKAASIVYIDCDIYESCAPVLRFITGLLVTGSVVMFDDWLSYKGDPEKGVQRACREWLADNPEIELRDWQYFGAYGKSFIVKRKEKA
jgi:hypothetical protein